MTALVSRMRIGSWSIGNYALWSSDNTANWGRLFQN
jgi:hypothetical protein